MSNHYPTGSSNSTVSIISLSVRFVGTNCIVDDRIMKSISLRVSTCMGLPQKDRLIHHEEEGVLDGYAFEANLEGRVLLLPW